MDHSGSRLVKPAPALSPTTTAANHERSTISAYAANRSVAAKARPGCVRHIHSRLTATTATANGLRRSAKMATPAKVSGSSASTNASLRLPRTYTVASSGGHSMYAIAASPAARSPQRSRSQAYMPSPPNRMAIANEIRTPTTGVMPSRINGCATRNVALPMPRQRSAAVATPPIALGWTALKTGRKPSSDCQ